MIQSLSIAMARACFATAIATLLVASGGQLIAGIPQPRIMAVMDHPDSVDQVDANSTPLAEGALTAINRALASAQYDVVDLVQILRSNARRDAKLESKGNVDKKANLTFLGADIYFVCSPEIASLGRSRKGSISIKVTEAVTGTLLGSATGATGWKEGTTDKALVEEATNNAVNVVIQQVQTYWNDVPKKGIPIILNISSSVRSLLDDVGGMSLARHIDAFLDSAAVSYRGEDQSERSAQYNPVYIDIVKYDGSAKKFSYKLEDYLKALGVKAISRPQGKAVDVEVK
jgi:hypothetical protein